MLDIFLLASTSLPPHPSISLSINQVQSIATSNVDNVDGVTPNPLLQQMYGTKVLDDDVDLELSDEELELVAGQQVTSCITPSGNVNKGCSDIFYRDNKGKETLVIDYNIFKNNIQPSRNEYGQVDYICEQFEAKKLLNTCCQYSELNKEQPCEERSKVAEVVWTQIRDPNVVKVKQAHNGLLVDLKTGQVVFRN